MAIASKPTRGLNVFAFRYVNSQCQHDSLVVKLAAKLHLFAEAAKFFTDYFIPSFSYILCIYFFLLAKFVINTYFSPLQNNTILLLHLITEIVFLARVGWRFFFNKLPFS